MLTCIYVDGYPSMLDRVAANVAQALNDAANEITGLKNDIAQLSTEIDSLRQIVVKQDSNIVRIAAANNVPISR